jgi:hypothetical protein
MTWLADAPHVTPIAAGEIKQNDARMSLLADVRNAWSTR